MSLHDVARTEYVLSVPYMRRAFSDGKAIFARVALAHSYQLIFYNESVYVHPVFSPGARGSLDRGAGCLINTFPKGEEPVFLREENGDYTARGLEFLQLLSETGIRKMLPPVMSDPNFEGLPPLEAALCPLSLHRRIPACFFNMQMQPGPG